MEKKGLLEYLNEQVENRKSFQQIMSDGVVTDAEIQEQETLVENLIGKIEKTFSAQDFQLVTDLLAEVSVLQVIFQLKNNQKGE